jgi:hypothetical protein
MVSRACKREEGVTRFAADIRREVDVMRSVLVIALLAGLLGCSGQPQAPDAEARSAATPPAPAAAETAADAPAVATPAAAARNAAATGGAAKVVKKIPSGYRLVKRGDTELYCRSEVMLGSRFPQKMCFTREQLDEIESRTDSAMGDMERGRKVCVGEAANCGGGG